MLERFKSFFPSNSLGNISAVLGAVHQLVVFFEKNIENDSVRNAAIDAVIELLQSEKR